MIEGGAFDLNGAYFLVVTTVAKDKTGCFRAISKVKLGAKLLWKAGLLERGQDAHFVEDGAVVGEERLADVEPGKNVFLQDEDFAARTSKVGGSGRPTRASADHERIEDRAVHLNIKGERKTRSKRAKGDLPVPERGKADTNCGVYAA